MAVRYATDAPRASDEGDGCGSSGDHQALFGDLPKLAREVRCHGGSDPGDLPAHAISQTRAMAVDAVERRSLALVAAPLAHQLHERPALLRTGGVHTTGETAASLELATVQLLVTGGAADDDQPHAQEPAGQSIRSRISQTLPLGWPV